MHVDRRFNVGSVSAVFSNITTQGPHEFLDYMGSAKCVSHVWEINEADIQLTNALYPVAQEAMRRGYYLPNRGSAHCSHHQCPHWRRCEQDFGGVVEP